MLALIDGDILLFKFGCPNTTKLDWGDSGGIQTIVDYDSARQQLDRFIGWLKQTTGASQSFLCLTNGRCFRYDLWPTYKAHRKGIERPELIGVLKQYLIDNYECKIQNDLEADDLLGLHQDLTGVNTCILSIDKDMLQIPGLHFNWNSSEYFRVSALQGDLSFYTQVLTGDHTDNYPGCPGIGPKKAAKILSGQSDPSVIWKLICLTYAEAGLTEEDALVQARLARILRGSESSLKLWVPPECRKEDAKSDTKPVPRVHSPSDLCSLAPQVETKGDLGRDSGSVRKFLFKKPGV